MLKQPVLFFGLLKYTDMQYFCNIKCWHDIEWWNSHTDGYNLNNNMVMKTRVSRDSIIVIITRSTFKQTAVTVKWGSGMYVHIF